MAQIIKHRRGSIDSVVGTTAKKGEIIMATGSIGNMNGPWIFIGETEGVAGAYRPASKIYQGSTAPTISVGSYGSAIDGTPFYSTTDETLYILSKDGNSNIDLTGNIEGNVISGVTINVVSGTTANYQNISGSFTGSGIGLFDIPASGITGLELNRISEGSATASISQTDGLRINTKTEVTGALIVTEDITGSNMLLTGNAEINGNITLGGNITIGDQTSDIISFGGEVSSSIVPDIHNSFDLGSTDKNWRNLHVSGTAYVDTLEARQVNFSDLGILEDLTVSGNTYLGNGGDILVVSGSAYYDSLTNNRVIIAGTNGLLEDDANFTFDGTELNIGQGNFTVQQGSGNIDTAGTLNVGGATTLESTLVVTGSTTLKDSLSVTGSTTIDGATIINNTLTTNGDTTVNGVLSVTGNTELGGNLYVSGNLEVLGSATEVHIQSQTVEIDDNIIRLNAYSPFERYAGFEVIDSGSSGVSASLVWDSLNDYWMFVSASGESSKLIGTTAGTYGSEVSLTTNIIPKGTGANTLGNSLLGDDATTLTYNTNKFTVASTDGATLIAGNVTLSSAGGSDAGTNSSAIVFKNSSNVLGYVSTTESTDVLDGILGYKNSDGALVFSTVIDGGSY